MPSPENSAPLIDRLLSVISDDILPLTEQGVAAGNKVFGAALLYKKDFSMLLAETNNELENPLLHGEIHALERYHALPDATRPAPAELIFLSTHEPCSLCLSAITWSGFDNFYYLFSHTDSRDSFAIPHDLKILKEVFDCEPGQYRRQNAFWSSFGIEDLILDQNDAQKIALLARVEAIKRRYAELSDQYQVSKSDNRIPLN